MATRGRKPSISKTAPIKTTTAAKPKKKVELVEKSYRLIGISPLSYILDVGRSGRLIHFDESKNRNRAIRYCPNEQSIFIDEQSDVAVVEGIIFYNGVLHTKEQDVILQTFLEASPAFGKKYDLINNAKEAEEMLVLEDIILEIKNTIRMKSKTEEGIEQMKLILSVLQPTTNTDNFSPGEVRYALFTEVDTNYKRFVGDNNEVTIFDNPEVQRKAIINKAFKSGTIKLSNDARSVMWTSNNAVILDIPPGKNYLEHFAKWLETEQGILVMQEIAKE
jgi:hypothetical protein